MRHKWAKDPGTENLFEDTYRVEKCIKCGLLKTHEYRGRQFLQGYIKDGRRFDKLPECIVK